MNPLLPLAPVAAVALGATLSTGVRWQPSTPVTVPPTHCVLTAAPWDQRTYALEVTVAGQPQTLIAKGDQDGDHFPSTTWTFPVGDLTEVRWAWMGDRWGDVLPVDGCRFTVTYHATPGRQDSVTIHGTNNTPPVTAIEPTTTTGPPTVTYATTPINPQLSPPTAPPPTVGEVDSSVPSATPPADGPTTTTLYTANTIPVTGAPTQAIVTGGTLAAFAGLLALAFTPVRRRLHKENR